MSLLGGLFFGETPVSIVDVVSAMNSCHQASDLLWIDNFSGLIQLGQHDWLRHWKLRDDCVEKIYGKECCGAIASMAVHIVIKLVFG